MQKGKAEIIIVFAVDSNVQYILYTTVPFEVHSENASKKRESFEVKKMA
jgi:hypothetical protein